MEAPHLSDRLWKVIIQEVLLSIKVDNRNRQKILKLLCNSQSSCSRPTTAMWRGECFMQVEEAEVKSSLSRPRDTQYPVGIGLVIPAQPSGIMDDSRELCDLRVEYPRILM